MIESGNIHASERSGNELSAESSWCCLRCPRNEETLTASHLRVSSGVAVFCPRIRFRQVSQKTEIWVSEPLFPGYFFAKLNPRVLAQAKGTYGVFDVMKSGDRYAVLSDEVIRKIKHQTKATETGDPGSALIPGERWRIQDSSADDLDIIILQILPARERIKLLLKFLQEQAAAQLSVENLFPSIAGGSELLKFAARVRVQPARHGRRRGLERSAVSKTNWVPSAT
jgi:transcriptional antiterminator RfaH